MICFLLAWQKKSDGVAAAAVIRFDSCWRPDVGLRSVYRHSSALTCRPMLQVITHSAGWNMVQRDCMEFRSWATLVSPPWPSFGRVESNQSKSVWAPCAPDVALVSITPFSRKIMQIKRKVLFGSRVWPRSCPCWRSPRSKPKFMLQSKTVLSSQHPTLFFSNAKVLLESSAILLRLATKLSIVIIGWFGRISFWSSLCMSRANLASLSSLPLTPFWSWGIGLDGLQTNQKKPARLNKAHLFLQMECRDDLNWNQKPISVSKQPETFARLISWSDGA